MLLKPYYWQQFFVLYMFCFFDEGKILFILYSLTMAAGDEFGAVK
jgi:hypothetical protein